MNIKQQNSISLFTVAATVPTLLRTLDPVSLLHLSATSQDFYRLVNDDLVWKGRVSQHVGVSMPRMPPKIKRLVLSPRVAGVTETPWKSVALGMEVLDCEEAVAPLTPCNRNAVDAYNAAVSY